VIDTSANTGALRAVMVVLSPADTVVGLRLSEPISGKSEITRLAVTVWPLLVLTAVMT